MSSAALVCAVALELWTSDASSWYASRLDSMREVCEYVAHAAESRGHDPALMVSLAWEESRLTWAESAAGALGPLQVLPSHWCPGGEAEGCDLVLAGFEAFESFSERWPEIPETLCHYNSGNVCGPRSRAYSGRILRRYDELLEALDGKCGC